jgi:hypothetical protein
MDPLCTGEGGGIREFWESYGVVVVVDISEGIAVGVLDEKESTNGELGGSGLEPCRGRPVGDFKRPLSMSETALVDPVGLSLSLSLSLSLEDILLRIDPLSDLVDPWVSDLIIGKVPSTPLEPLSPDFLDCCWPIVAGTGVAMSSARPERTRWSR